MRAFGDEEGFFWNQPIKIGRTAAATVVREPMRKPAAPADYKLPAEFPQFSRYKRLSLDLETLDPNLKTKGCGAFRGDGHIVGVGIRSHEWEGDYYPIGHAQGCPNLDKEKVIRWLSDELTNYEGEITGANLQYDAEWLASVGVRFPKAKIIDTQWAEPLIDENAYSYKLNVLSHKYLGHGKITDELEDLYGPSYIEHMDQVHPGHMRGYVMGDITQPLLIIDKQLEELDQQRLMDLYRMECRQFNLLLYMREQGVRIDLKAAQHLGLTLEGKIKDTQAEIKHLSGVNVQVWASNSVSQAFDKMGIPYPRTAGTARNPNGQPSFTAPWLGAHESRLAELILAERKFDKFKGTFVDKFLAEAVNGRLHCSFHPLRSDDSGTVSGRYSSSNPNLQQVPIRDEIIGPLIRALFIPEEGQRWWSKDFSQIEYRFLVHYAVLARCRGAEVAAEMYRNDPKTDFHILASQLTGLPRKQAKNINFGIVYGMGEETMGHNMGKSREEVRPILGNYHEMMPFCREIYKLASNCANDQGFVRTVLGRKRRFELWEPHYIPNREERPKALPHDAALEAYGERIKRAFTHKALNGVLQGSSADLTKLSMVKIWEAGLIGPSDEQVSLSLTVHDELDGSAPPTEKADEALSEAHNIMVNALELKVPVMVDSKTGANWNEAH